MRVFRGRAKLWLIALDNERHGGMPITTPWPARR
jgi:hypothetical protein